MLPVGELRALEDSLLEICQHAFEAGHYEGAYHTLMAALHLASDEADSSRVRVVEAIAESQRDFIDVHAPSHRMSTASAKSRGHTGPYFNLLRQAAAVRQLIEQRAEWGKPHKVAEPAEIREPS